MAKAEFPGASTEVGHAGDDACSDCGHRDRARPLFPVLRARLGLSTIHACDDPYDLDGQEVLDYQCGCENLFHTRA